MTNRQESQRFECVIIELSILSNPRYCLGCATKKIDIHSFIFYNCYFDVPYICQFCVNQEERPNVLPSVQKMYPACA